MSERRQRTRSKNRTIAFVSAGLVHILVIGAALFNYTGKPNITEGFDADKVDVVKATTVDESQIQRQQEKLKQQERDRQLKKEQEQKRLDDLKLQSQKEKERIEELEAERKAIALKKQQEEAKRKKELAERKKREKEEKERKAKLAAEKKEREEKERIERETREFEAQQRLNALLEEEERLRAQQEAARLAEERTATLVNRTILRITEVVNLRRTISPDFERWRVTKLNIILSPQGDVISVAVVESSGSERYDRSAETAIRQASPLPIPSIQEDVQANEKFRDFNFYFRMPGAN